MSPPPSFAARHHLCRLLHIVDRHLPHRPTRKTRRRPPPLSAAATMPDLGGSRGLVTSLTNIHGEYGTTNYLAGTAAGGKDHHHGLRLLCVDTGGWICIAYADNDPIDCAAIVQRRVGFLLRYPRIIPMYSLVECNCECVTMWCKTGQCAGAFDGGGIFQWRQQWTKARRRGQRETQHSNRGDSGGGWHQ